MAGGTNGFEDDEMCERYDPDAALELCCIELRDAKNKLRAAEDSLRVEREYSNRLYSLLSDYQDPPARPR